MDVASLPQVINKTDLAEAVGADLKVMERDSIRMRDGGPFVFAQVLYQYPLFFCKLDYIYYQLFKLHLLSQTFQFIH